MCLPSVGRAISSDIRRAAEFPAHSEQRLTVGDLRFANLVEKYLCCVMYYTRHLPIPPVRMFSFSFGSRRFGFTLRFILLGCFSIFLTVRPTFPDFCLLVLCMEKSGIPYSGFVSHCSHGSECSVEAGSAAPLLSHCSHCSACSGGAGSGAGGVAGS